ncbi:hypothetical protein AX16_007986 [Volvariella volvacea WC 439]|nr:hypothetical protein AX16_007986 [Volvariella volvacea WC 439]
MSFINPALDQAKAQTVTVPSPSPDDQFPPLSLPRSNSSPVSLVDRVALLSRPSAFKPSLKKRHSTYVLASPASPTSFRLAPPALQTMTPHRSGPPPRRPVHSIIHNPTYPAQTRPDSRPPSTTATTGTMEEVTPWELFNPPSHDGHASPKHSVDSAFLSTPLPPLASSSHIVRSSLSTGLVEDVTPWELYEPPIIEEVLATPPVIRKSAHQP